MKSFASRCRFIPPAMACILTAALSIFLASCAKKNETAQKDRFPLIANTAQLEAASSEAGAKMVVLDLYADWCRPCRMLEPTLHELAAEFKEKAVFYRVNVDQSRDLAQLFGVRGIPMVVFMREGTLVYALTGLNPKESYAKVLGICSEVQSAEECAGKITERM